MTGLDSSFHARPFYSDEFCTIYQGDSREILPHLDADVMVTDPPYGYAYASNKVGKFQGQQIANDHDVSARDEVLAAWGDRPALVFGSWKRPRPEATREVLIWHKCNAPIGMGDLTIPWGSTQEEIYVLGKWFIPEGKKRSGSVLPHKPPVTWSGDKAGAAARLHPNEKPIALMRDLIGKCPPGTIIDPFMGSGSTLRAAKDLGRHCIGIELDPKWCAVAVGRLAQDNLFSGEAA